MPRRRTYKPQRAKSTHRTNRYIRARSVRVIGPDGDQLGIMPSDDARRVAQEAGLDLVEVAPNARPPVCRVMDYGKFMYQQSKRKSKGSSSAPKTKTLRLRPKIDDHDLNIKLDKARDFLDSGNSVRLVMRLRGRENAYRGRWLTRMNGILKDLAPVAEVRAQARSEGRTITAMVAPISEGASAS